MPNSSDLDDDDAIFAQLQDEIDNHDSAAFREHGQLLLKKEADRISNLKATHHGQYTEVTAEKDVMDICAREKRCVVHFYHPDFKRCEIMDKHLAALASKYISTRFFRVFVENVPWLVQRLSIQILPCVMCFIDGNAKDRLIGFEELGNDDSFQTAILEFKLNSLGVIQKESDRAEKLFKVASSSRPDDKEEDSDLFDLDE